jgi:putative flippase GtrA
VIKTALALTGIAMALGVFVQVRNGLWWLAAVMAVIGIGALVLLGFLFQRDQQESIS